MDESAAPKDTFFEFRKPASGGLGKAAN